MRIVKWVFGGLAATCCDSGIGMGYGAQGSDHQLCT